ncbi:MAG: rod shape-determining protein MreC [Opitutales bacterium]
MSKERTALLKPFILLGVFVVGWFLVPGFLRVVQPLKDLVESGLDRAFYEIQAPAWIGTSYLEDIQATVDLTTRSRRELAEWVRDLTRENARLRLERQQLADQSAYLDRLEDLLELPSLPRYRYEVARVVRRDQSAWWHQVVIRKGANAEIPEGAAVVFTGGVVGRVKEVYSTTSVVELVTSPRFRMAANFVDDLRPVTYQGRVNPILSRPQGTVYDAPADITPTPEQPRRLVSSHLGGVFPSGITIGYVTELEPGPDGLFQTGRVLLDPRLTTLREVAVLLPIEPVAPETAAVPDPS